MVSIVEGRECRTLFSVPTKLVYLIGRNEERANTLLFNGPQASAFNSRVNYRFASHRMTGRTHAKQGAHDEYPARKMS